MKKVLSPGEKVKKLRTDLGLKQDDITGNILSKALISLIEREKRGVTIESAKVIVDCLNKYYEKSGRTITVEYLLETEKDVARKEILKYIKHLTKAISAQQVDEDLIQDTFEKTLHMIKEGNFKKEYIQLKILQGDFHYRNYQFSDAINDYLDVLDHSMKTSDYDQVARVYILLGRAFQMQLMLDNALVHYSKAINTAIEHNTKNKNKVMVYTMFNQILCYRKLKRYDWALGQIGSFKELKWNNPLYEVYYNQVLLIEANTYRDLENWDKAKASYEKLLSDDRNLDKETLFLVYENYGVYHRNRGHRNKALDYLKKARDIKEYVSFDHVPVLFLYEATCYNLEEEYDKVITLLKDGLTLAEAVDKKHVVIELRFALVEVALRIKNYETALQHLQIVEELLKENVVKHILNDLYSYYARVYLGLGDLVKSDEYNKKILQKDYFWD